MKKIPIKKIMENFLSSLLTVWYQTMYTKFSWIEYSSGQGEIPDRRW